MDRLYFSFNRSVSMRKVFSRRRALKNIESHLLEILSERELKILLLLVTAAEENNGMGEIEPEIIQNSVEEYSFGRNLFVVCQILKNLGWGRLTCCKGQNSKKLPCLGEDWKNLHIGVVFSESGELDEEQLRKINRDIILCEHRKVR